MSLRIVLFCLLASTGGRAESNACQKGVDGTSSCFEEVGSDQSALLQSHLGVVGDAARYPAVNIEETRKPITPLVSCGKTFYILGISDVQNGNCFCYKLVMCDTLYQHTPAVGWANGFGDSCSDWSNEKCEHSGLKWNTVMGKRPVNSADGMSQSYTGGTSNRGCRTSDGKRKSSLTMVADNSKEELSIEVIEPETACDYAVEVTGPIKKLEAKTTPAPTTPAPTTPAPTKGPIAPSRACGQTFYILGVSDVQNGNCFCYKIVMCDTLYQHTPAVAFENGWGDSCSDWSNEKCEHSGLEWNTVMGKHPVNSADGMSQSYAGGTYSRGCRTPAGKRKSSLTMVADNSKGALSISVLEPDIACSYEVEVSGPLSQLLRFQ